MIGRYRIPSQSPAVTRKLFLGLDQPERGALCKSLLNVSQSEYAIPNVDHCFQILPAEFRFAPQPVNSERARDGNLSQVLACQVEVENHHAIGKKRSPESQAGAAHGRAQSVPLLITSEPRNGSGDAHNTELGWRSGLVRHATSNGQDDDVWIHQSDVATQRSRFGLRQAGVQNCMLHVRICDYSSRSLRQRFTRVWLRVEGNRQWLLYRCGHHTYGGRIIEALF